MKRLIVLLCAVLAVCLILCSCMQTSAGKVSDKAKETVDSRQNATVRSGDDKGLFDDNRETTLPTEKNSMMETVMDAVATEWDEMVENGEIDDGDGNVGDRENEDGDGNIDPDAVD